MSANRANIDYHLENMIGFPSSSSTLRTILKLDSGDVLLAYGNSAAVPDDSTAGYSPGCLIIEAENGKLYINEGDADDCDFDAVSTV